MKNFASLMILLGSLAICSAVQAQSRDAGAQRLVLDNGSGGKLTLQYSGVGNSTLSFPTNPAPIPSGGAANQTLYWNGTNWVGSSSLQNNGTNVTMTGNLTVNSPGSTIGSTADVVQLNVNGPGAAGTANHLLVNGNMRALGKVASGNSIVLDGVTIPRSITSDNSLTISASGVITLVPTGSVNLQGNLNTIGTSYTTGNAAVQGSFIIGSVGTPITQVVAAAAPLNFGSTAANSCSDLTMVVSGAQAGDAVQLAVDPLATLANSNYTAWVSGVNTVTVRFCNVSGGAQDPAGGTFKAIVTRF